MTRPAARLLLRRVRQGELDAPVLVDRHRLAGLGRVEGEDRRAGGVAAEAGEDARKMAEA
jgi:hypothetical protein